MDNAYAAILEWCVHHRRLVVIFSLLVFFGVLGSLLPFLKTEFFPTQDNARIGITIELPIGTRQEITRKFALDLNEKFMKKYPEIRACNFTEGSANTDNVWASIQNNGTHIIKFNISLLSVGDRERGLQDICNIMRADLAEYPIIKTYQVLAGGGGGGMGGESTVDVDIYGFDFAQTDLAAAQVKDKMLSIPKVNQVHISREEYIPEFEVDFDREKLAINGLNVSTASSFLRNRINGALASYYREDGDEYEIRVRYAPEFRQSVEDIENILVYNTKGEGIRIRDLGVVKETLTPPTIERKNRERVVTVSVVVPKGVAMSDIVAGARAQLATMEWNNNLSWQLSGTFEDQQDTFGDLITLMVLIRILVFIVMASQFESLTYPFVIMFSIPFALVGVLMGLFVTGTPMSIMAMIGLMMLLGIVVKNGIVLIDYIILCRERGLGVVHAVTTAGRSRLRPVLMTTLTTVLGMIPMAVGTGEGSELWRAMGMTVAWGLSVSTLITLVIVPVMYCIFAGNGIMGRRRKSLKLARLNK